MFSEDEKKEFKPYVKKKFDNDLLIQDALISAYLDVCRGPLRGINKDIKEHNPNLSSVKVRDAFIKESFIPMIKDLINNNQDYDNWHLNMCNSIICFYNKNGYTKMTYGKAQKWINMSMKYIMLYTNDYRYHNSLLSI